MVRRYCKEGRIKSAIQFEGNWLIPEGTPKPGADIDDEDLLPPLAKKMLYQHARNNHYGIYEYMQISLAYCSNRMASNRLTQKQIEDIYRTNKLCRAFEATKVDDIIEIVNHFICMRYVMDNLTAPLTISFIKQLHQLLSYGTFVTESIKRVLVSLEQKTVSSVFLRIIFKRSFFKWQWHMRGNLQRWMTFWNSMWPWKPSILSMTTTVG